MTLVIILSLGRAKVMGREGELGHGPMASAVHALSDRWEWRPGDATRNENGGGVSV